MTASACRFCGTELRRSFVDLGRSPLSNAFLTADQLREMEPHYPLHAYVCENCLLVQLEAFASPATIFTDYAYFSSFSETWLRHAESYATRMKHELGLGADSLVVELASNDGYLLQYFRRQGIAVLGVEPAANVAAVAEARGVPTEVAFFGVATAHRLAAAGKQADLICANNVLAHVPDLNDFVAGLPILLKPSGTITVEFPHLLRLIEDRQFDTIYHEHFSYFSLLVVDKVFARHGLSVFDVDRLSDAWRFAAHPCLPCGSRAPAHRSVRRGAGRGGGSRARRSDDLRPVRRERDRREVPGAGVPHRGAARGQAGRRLWRAGQGQHAAELLRRRTGAAGVHRRSQSAQAGTLPARHADPDPARPSGSSRPGPTTCSSCRGT